MTWLAESMASVQQLRLGAGHSHVAGPSLTHQACSPSPEQALMPCSLEGMDKYLGWAVVRDGEGGVKE